MSETQFDSNLEARRKALCFTSVQMLTCVSKLQRGRYVKNVRGQLSSKCLRGYTNVNRNQLFRLSACLPIFLCLCIASVCAYVRARPTSCSHHDSHRCVRCVAVISEKILSTLWSNQDIFFKTELHFRSLPIKRYFLVAAQLVLSSCLSRNFYVLASKLSETAMSLYPSGAVICWSGSVEGLCMDHSSSLELACLSF